MIKVEHLTKRYASHTAVNDLSFEVERGEIVGFLGPNGAGKSTTMRILSCFLPATTGRATVAGFDVFSQSLDVRRHLGYMPENVPLYTDMRVTEYLNYRAALKGLSGGRLKTRVGAVKELTDLRDVENKLIGKLSKGYRQRVGLAEAMVHEPDLLILDEPTIGLDPNQIRQVRDLIKDLGQRHTILLSTHILPEVEMTCSRVLIINKGRVVASDTPANLPGTLRSAGNIHVEADAGAEDAAAELRKVRGVKDVAPVVAAASAESPAVPAPSGRGHGFQEFELRVEAGADPRLDIYELARARNWKLRELSLRRATLEDVFVEITHTDAH
ncbi:MAG: ATP-binding cassette domain-containing protein [Verrucomicrobia bacterium]|nr:ATP-binding cassette domain-containing protein [Verrucomicrobiota bacterium]